MPPPSLTYAHAASRTALSLIVAEAHAEEGERTHFEAVERSASEALLDVFSRFLRSLGGAARSAAQHAGRSESNLADMLVGLGAVSPAGAGLTLSELAAFVEDAPEVAFPANVSAFPVAPAPLSAAATAAAAVSADPRPAHVPDFLPPFPEKRTYSHTATSNSRASDAPAAKKRRSKNRQQAQDSLLNLADAARGGPAGGDAMGPPPPPLPALPAADATMTFEQEAMQEGSGGASGSGAAELHRVPDVLVPSMPAVLQSAARLETSGFVHGPAFGQPTREPPADAGGVAAAIAAAPPRQQAILGLKHLQGLDRIDEGRGVRRAERDEFDD